MEIMDELLCLKWSNHRNSLNQQLSVFRQKSSFADVTLACDGKLYLLHKIILSSCSDYFRSILESISCPNPVIILKDISAAHLEVLIDYMYMGEARVLQRDLSSVIQAAECLKVKGIALPYNEGAPKPDAKRTFDPLLSPKKLQKKIPKTSTLIETEEIIIDSPIQPTEIVAELKMETDSLTIKEETVCESEEYTTAWDFAPDNENPLSFNTKQNVGSIGSSPLQCRTDPLKPGPNSNIDVSSIFPDKSPASTMLGKQRATPSISKVCHPKMASKFKSKRNQQILPCPFCSKEFRFPAQLKLHTRIHTGDKPYACPHCPYGAALKATLNEHMISKHKDTSTVILAEKTRQDLEDATGGMRD